jgi:hypothetical protein
MVTVPVEVRNEMLMFEGSIQSEKEKICRFILQILTTIRIHHLGSSYFLVSILGYGALEYLLFSTSYDFLTSFVMMNTQTLHYNYLECMLQSRH